MKKNLMVILILLLLPLSAYAVPVGTELVLLADVSGSLDDADFNLQRDGYAAAFKDAGIIDLIQGTTGGIAVSLVYWSGSQSIAVDWTHLTDADSSNAFADVIAATTRPFSGSTGLANAMNFGTTLFTTDNGYEGETWVMDISGDGADSQYSYNNQDCPACQTARDAAVLAGVDMINALWINDRDYFGDDPEDFINAVLYGETNVIAGAGSFSRIVQDFDGFAAGITDKIYTELQPQNPVPEPATMVLFGLGLVGLAGVSRKKLKK
jgi:hypothetical protein